MCAKLNELIDPDLAVIEPDGPRMSHPVLPFRCFFRLDLQAPKENLYFAPRQRKLLGRAMLPARRTARRVNPGKRSFVPGALTMLVPESRHVSKR